MSAYFVNVLLLFILDILSIFFLTIFPIIPDIKKSTKRMQITYVFPYLIPNTKVFPAHNHTNYYILIPPIEKIVNLRNFIPAGKDIIDLIKGINLHAKTIHS